MTRAGRSAAPGAVDWAELRRRVEDVGRALASGPVLSPDRARAVLEERARALSRPLAQSRAEGGIEALAFALSEEVIALEARYVFEVFRPGDVARLPGAEPPVFGVAAWRGALLKVLDVRSLLGVRAGPAERPKLVAVLGEERPSFGIVVDATRGVLRLDAADIRPAPEAPGVAIEYVRGLTGAAVLVLEVPALLRRYGGAR